jgi:hypothetical protein
MSSDPSKKPDFDLDEAQRLIEALERDLAKARAGSSDLAALRSEVEQLRAALSAAETAHGEVHEGLHGIRALLHEAGEELLGDALKASDYVVRIGRLLGM